MNPPFGTRNTGIDAEFVTIAMRNARSVYSLHKTSTRDVRTSVHVRLYLGVFLFPSFFQADILFYDILLLATKYEFTAISFSEFCDLGFNFY